MVVFDELCNQNKVCVYKMYNLFFAFPLAIHHPHLFLTEVYIHSE